MMYFFDLELGRRRRKLCLDQMQRAENDCLHACDVLLRDLSNRASGTVARVESCFSQHDNSDRVVGERVRSKLGRCVSHPSAIQVAAHDGQVTLTGHVLASEVAQLIWAVHGVTGVRSVDNQLAVHESAGKIASLQGDGRRGISHRQARQQNWSPTARFLAGAVGTCLVANGLLARSPMSAFMAAMGTALLATAASREKQASASRCCQTPAASTRGADVEVVVGPF